MNRYETRDGHTVVGYRVVTQEQLEARRRRLLKRLDWTPVDRPLSFWERVRIRLQRWLRD